ncbi:hypothetical protein ACFL2T_06905, partial [Elusimicrobiota bacterium]
MLSSILQVLWFVVVIAAAVAVIEAYLYVHFTYYDRRWFLPAVVLSVPAAGLFAAGFTLGGQLDPGKALSLGVSLLVVEAAIALFFQHVVRGRHSLPYMLLVPGLLGLMLLIVYPLVFEVYLAFHDLKLTTVMHWSRTGELPFVGLRQFGKVFTSSPLS